MLEPCAVTSKIIWCWSEERKVGRKKRKGGRGVEGRAYTTRYWHVPECLHYSASVPHLPSSKPPACSRGVGRKAEEGEGKVKAWWGAEPQWKMLSLPLLWRAAVVVQWLRYTGANPKDASLIVVTAVTFQWKQSARGPCTVRCQCSLKNQR